MRPLDVVLSIQLLFFALASSVGAQTFAFDDLPFLSNLPEAFPSANFNGGGEVQSQDARSAPHSLMLYGNDNSAQTSYGYYLAYTVNIAVTPGTQLTYWVKPLAGTTSFAVDLLLDDGTYLRDSGATDQYGVRVHPYLQGVGGHLVMNQYNQVITNIGEWLAGRTITQIIVAFDRPPTIGWVNAVFDDITISQRSVPSCAGTPCSTTLCVAGCDETSMRNAVQAANGCSSDPSFTRRTITLPNACTLNLQNTTASAGGVATCTTETPVFQPSVCVTGHDTWIDLADATVNYSGSVVCDPNADSAGPPAFVLRGTRNAVRRATVNFFPEGMLIRTGTDNRIEYIQTQYFCDEAISIGDPTGSPPASAPQNPLMRKITLTGKTQHCRCAGGNCTTGALGTCGSDKAIQANSGSNVTLTSSTFTNCDKPLLVQIGVASSTISYNQAYGSSSSQNVCQSITVEGGTSTVTGNWIENCKYGLVAAKSSIVTATDNTIKTPWVSAFNVRDSARLMGQGNRMKTRSAGFGSSSDCQRGLLVAKTGGSVPRVDFGGGDFSAVSVVNNTACSAGGTCSTGGNKFCSSGTGTQTDIWNITDCPCVNTVCSSTFGLCTMSGTTPCCPVDVNTNWCINTGGVGASVGARTNCFQGSADIEDSGGSTTNIAGATTCTSADCTF